MDKEELIGLDHKTPGKEELELKSLFRQHLVGQDRAIDRVVRKVILANAQNGQLRDLRKPPGVFLFLGPTGVGKTQLVRIFAKILFDSFDALLLTDCTGLREKHELSALVGSPPGYIGSDREPGITQVKLDYWDFSSNLNNCEAFKQLKKLEERDNQLLAESKKLLARFQEIKKKKEKEFEKERNELSKKIKETNSLIIHTRSLSEKIAEQNGYWPGRYRAIWLLDEIEKAPPDIFKLLMPVVDEARLVTHGRSRTGNTVYFHNTFIFMTSNLAKNEIQNFLRGKNLGFAPMQKKGARDIQTNIYRIVIDTLEDSKRSPIPIEFIGRIGKENIVVFSPLSRENMLEGLNRIIIPNYQNRLTGNFPVMLKITEEAREYMISESCDQESVLGMRALEEVFKKRVEENISSLIAKTLREGGIIQGDKITVDLKTAGNKKELQFLRAGRESDQQSQKNIIKAAPDRSDEEEHDGFIHRIPVVFKPYNKKS